MKKIVLSALLANSLIMAAQTPLTTHTELGYIETDGNTKTKTFNLDAKAKKSFDKHVFNALIDAQYASDSTNGPENEIKNKYLAELNYDYQLDDRFSFNYLAGYKEDKFSSFINQYYTGPGAKYKAIVSEKQNLSLEASALYAADNYNNSPAVTKDNDSYAAYRVQGLYDLQVLENLKFNQEVSMRGSVEDTQNYFVYSKSVLTSKLSDMFSAGLSYKIDYVAEPITGVKGTDTTLTFNLIIDY